MQTILGPFHPHLEDALVEEILRFKASDPLRPLLIVVPSDALRRRLKVLLSRELRLSLLNLQILTFHQLSLKLFAEVNGALAPAIHEDLFFEEALRQMIRARWPGTAAFAGMEERAGGCAALWQTLRDLRDGLVDPAVTLELLREGGFGSGTASKTADLIALLENVLRFRAEKDIKDHSDLVKSAAAQAPLSPYLKQLAHLFCYGFYDLTQLQLDFFYALIQHYPTTVFFPLLASRPPHDGWSFAEQFYQRYLQGRVAASRNLAEPGARRKPLPLTFGVFDQQAQRGYQRLAKNWRCQILNTFGIDDEVSAVAKEILRLTADEGTALCEIGVVARALETYGPAIKQVFARHQIPITAAIDEPLVQFPLAKAAVLLLDLPARDYSRPHVIDLLSSPYFQLNDCAGEAGDLRPDLWDLATRELAIRRGIKEWQRLERYTAQDLVIGRRSDDEERPGIKVPAAQIRALRRILHGLASDLGQLPAQASWTQYGAQWKDLLEKYLGITATPGLETDALTSIGLQIIIILDQIAALDAVKPEISLPEFSQTLQAWLQRATVITSKPNIDGVAVLNATAARGVQFRALFLVGMNEGVFPRTIREDAFLRDSDRAVIERDLGYKVSQKLSGFDEEKLLFSLLINSARDRLYCSFQRADENGRVLAPSWYLGELKRALGQAAGNAIKEVSIPRNLTDKAEVEPFNREELLLPEELAVRLGLGGQEIRSFMEEANLSPQLFDRGLKTIQQIDLSTERLGEFDGMLARAEPYWRGFRQRGLSPTGLELYGRCPFQYFALEVLGLERLEAPEQTMGPSAAEYGELGHAILNQTYQALIDRGYFDNNRKSVDVDSVLAAAAQTVFTQYETDHPIGYPLAWENLRENLLELVRGVIHRDLEALADSGYVPAILEAAVAHRLPSDWPEILRGLGVRGRMDRIDTDRNGARLRIVDYKFKLGAALTPADRDLVRAALRGEKLQPPIYSLLGQHWAESNRIDFRKPTVEASFFYIAPNWSDGPLVTKAFSADILTGKLGDEIKQTVADLVSGIQAGRFFMQRGAQCPYCEIQEICRKNHPPSLWRAENDPVSQAHRALHAKDPKRR